MNSMTGYGKALVAKSDRELTIELKSVNHRFLDINTKIPKMFIPHEDIIRSVLGQHFNRGHIDVFINFANKSDSVKTITIDYALAQGMVDASNQLANKYDIRNDFAVNALLRTQDLLRIEQQEEDTDLLREMLTEAVTNASLQLTNMRSIEGDKISCDILSRLDNVKNLLDTVAGYAPQVAEGYRVKLASRITEALQNIELDTNKLINEVAFFVDKSNIDEEIARLYCHIDNARDILADSQPIGRKLDFLIQEFNREANTICSKSNDVNMTNTALQLKNEIEKIREQVQNIE